MIESELKIPVASLDEILHRLAEVGAEQISPSEREVNILFDTADGRLAGAGQVLRVRRIGHGNILTFKGPASFEGAVKRRREIELDISSSGRMSELLHALGYAPSMRYEKDRESWRLGAARIDLDHTLMGEFVEIEGPDSCLAPTASQLGLDPADAVAQSYIGLWAIFRRLHPELGRDMVFDP